MSTTLPVMRANVEKEIKEQMEKLAKLHDRSLSKEISQACKHWIEVNKIELNNENQYIQ